MINFVTLPIYTRHIQVKMIACLLAHEPIKLKGVIYTKLSHMITDEKVGLVADFFALDFMEETDSLGIAFNHFAILVLFLNHGYGLQGFLAFLNPVAVLIPITHCHNISEWVV
ncbi:hypothetical protein C0583_00220 [Candidatus Parcubacteria bacterium]|nr:MAG: hypothetical protein C0583_00220 [Candidatus Parcubacteria bacterium]